MDKPWIVGRWDICPKLHAMNDMGIDSERTTKAGRRIYSRTRTYNAECYAEKDGERCTRRGRCILAYTD